MIKTYLARLNCEYTIEVEAETPEDAIKKAEQIETDDWGQAWSTIEIFEE